MKKLTLAALIALLTLTYCNKQYSGHYQNPLPVTDSTQALVDSAYAFMTQYEPTAPPIPDSLPYGRTSLHKTPIWSQAHVQRFSFGLGVVVPVTIVEPLTVRIGAAQISLSASRITWLLLYQDTAHQWHPEVITRLPSDTAASPFQGEVRVEDWQGHFLKGFFYTGQTTQAVATSQLYRRNIDSPTAPASSIETLEAAPATPEPGECNETDWYGCSTIGDGPVECSYVYTALDCPGVGDAAEESVSAGTPTPGDYSGVGSSGGLLTPATQSITCTSAISSNPIVSCVYNNLMNPSLANGLKTILAHFSDNTIYNVNFTLTAGLAADGMCTYQGNNTFLIQINESEADDPEYSRIWLASTFIHEAFHAKLRQQALETFGELAVSQWPKPIDDMTLSELATYFEQESKANNTWESAEHDWMVNNINALATSLESFVQTYYQSTYNSVGNSPAPYQALMLMGLQNSTFYTEQVTNLGLAAQYQTYCGQLNEGGKCSD